MLNRIAFSVSILTLVFASGCSSSAHGSSDDVAIARDNALREIKEFEAMTPDAKVQFIQSGGARDIIKNLAFCKDETLKARFKKDRESVDTTQVGFKAPSLRNRGMGMMMPR